MPSSVPVTAAAAAATPNRPSTDAVAAPLASSIYPAAPSTADAQSQGGSKTLVGAISNIWGGRDTRPVAVVETPKLAMPAETVKTVLVEEPGKPALKCRVVKQWQTAEGQKATQLQAIDSGEMVTIVETTNGRGSDAKTSAAMYRWGTSTTPPAGVPVPPGSNAVAKTDSQKPSTQKEEPKTTNTVTLPEVRKLIEVPQSTGTATTDVAKAMPNAPQVVADAPKLTPDGPGLVQDVVQPIPETATAAPQTTSPTATPAVTDAPKTKMRPQPPEPPKVEPKALPTAPPAEYKKQWSAPDPTAPAAEKPSTDITPPAGSVLPVNPTALPKLPEAVSSQPAATYTPVPTPSDLILGTATPSLAPTKSMLGSQSAKSDPLTNPELFTAGRTEPSKVSPTGVQNMDPLRTPLGAGSVVAAANGGDPRYLPVPMVTVPQTRPPLPPTQPVMPAQPPQQAPETAETSYANAFTPAQEASTNAFGVAQQQQPMMPPGYGAMPMGASYRGPMPPMPVAVAGGYPMPQMPMAYPMPQMPMGVAQGNPMPPRQPMSMLPPVQPTAMTQAQPAVVYANPAMDRPGMATAGTAQVQKCISTLQASISPLQRETAVNQLSTCDWRANPQIVTVLLTTAKEDPVGMVRVAAVTGLARMGIATDAVVATFTQLKTDADARVRMEAEQALKGIGR